MSKLNKIIFSFFLTSLLFAANDPILFFGTNDIDELQQKINLPEFSNTWIEILNEANNYCDTNSSEYADPDYFATNTATPGVLGHYLARQLTEWMQTLGFVYQMTDDKKYGNHGVELLISATENLPVDCAIMANSLSGMKGDMMRGIATGLDSISDCISTTEREDIVVVARDYIIEFIDEYDDPNTWWNDYHNYLGVCGGGSGMLGISLRNDYAGELNSWLQKSKECVEKWLCNSFDTNGAYFEGAAYNTYGMANTLVFADALNRYNDDNNILTNSTFDKVPYYLAMSILPGENVFDARNDSLYRNDFSGKGYGAPFLLYLASGYNGISNTNIAEWLWKKTGSNYNKFLQIIWGNDLDNTIPNINSLISKPSAVHFKKRGLCIWRSGWEKNDTMFSIEAGPYYKITHNQADKGHFNFYGLGYRWAVDAAYGNDRTSLTNRCSTLAHSCVLIDGKGQSPSGAGVGNNGKVLDYKNNYKYGYALIDAKAAYITNNIGEVGVPVTKALRHTFFVRPTNGVPAYAVVLDDIQQGSGNHDFTWQMITWENMIVSFDGDITTVRPPGDGPKPEMKVFINADGAISQDYDTYTPEGGAPKSIIRIHSTVNTVNPRFAAVLIPLPYDQAAPEVVYNRQGTNISIKIYWSNRIDEIIWTDQAYITFTELNHKYYDELTLQLLMHCDETNHPNSWLLSPDDHSSGRTYNQAVLDRALSSWTVDTATIPTLTSGSPYGGNYFNFDGVDDTIYIVNATSDAGWVTNVNNNIICDFSFRWLNKIATDRIALVMAKNWRIYLRPGGSTSLRLDVYLNGVAERYTSLFIGSNYWTDVHFSLVDGIAEIIFNDDHGRTGTDTWDASSFVDINSALSIGFDFASSSKRYLMGDIDEVRIGNLVKLPYIYDDDYDLKLLIHCDETGPSYQNSWFLTPDDNSSGRIANSPILNRLNEGWGVDNSTVPTLICNLPYNRNYLRFDGVNDSIYVSPGWNGNNNIFCDFSFRWLGFPVVSDDYKALVQTRAWRSYIRRAGADTCRIGFLANNNWLYSSVNLISDTWYNVHFIVINGDEILIVNDVTNLLSNVSLNQEASQITIGNDIFRPTSTNRCFFGDIDEVRIGIIPEPAMFLSIAIAGIFMLLKRK